MALHTEREDRAQSKRRSHLGLEELSVSHIDLKSVFAPAAGEHIS
jgi:hypothetical protein